MQAYVSGHTPQTTDRLRQVEGHHIHLDEVQGAGDCMIDGETARALAAIFRALGDPTRLRIISALAERELCVGELTAALEMAQPAVSHQLRDMLALRLVRSRKEGRHVYYRLDDEHVRDLFKLTLAHIRHSDGGERGLLESLHG